MDRRSTRRLAFGLAATGAVLATAACSDTRLEKLTTGIGRDSVLAIINEGASGDSLARVYRQETYLLPNKKGNAFLGNILFYDKRGRKQAEDSTVAANETTPIVLSDGKVIGWGWTFYDSLAKANNIPQQVRK
jgi:hypothetical protein